jgi:hypothetical protein
MRVLKSEGVEAKIYEALINETDKKLFALQKRQAGLIASAVSKMFK